jgi:Helix-turn-helix domain
LMLSDFDLLTLDDVALLLHCSKAHVSHIVAGEVEGCTPLPALRLGRRRLVRRVTLEAWVMENDRVSTNDNRKPVGRVRVLRASDDRKSA